jgi:hypothetical protein
VWKIIYLFIFITKTTEASQIVLQDVWRHNKTPTFYQNYLAMRNTAYVTGSKPIAVWSQSISGSSAIDPSVAFYDIHRRKRKVLFIYFVPDTTRDQTRLTLDLHVLYSDLYFFHYTIEYKAYSFDIEFRLTAETRRACAIQMVSAGFTRSSCYSDYGPAFYQIVARKITVSDLGYLIDANALAWIKSQ